MWSRNLFNRAEQKRFLLQNKLSWLQWRAEIISTGWSRNLRRISFLVTSEEPAADLTLSRDYSLVGMNKKFIPSILFARGPLIIAVAIIA
jgi:hypothetical protein